MNHKQLRIKDISKIIKILHQIKNFKYQNILFYFSFCTKYLDIDRGIRFIIKVSLRLGLEVLI